MPQIEIPFTPGQRVRTKDGREFIVDCARVTGGEWLYDPDGINVEWGNASDLTFVEPVIKWVRNGEGNGWRGIIDGYMEWQTFDDGELGYYGKKIGTFPDPRSVAEDTQTMWNARKK